MVFFLLHNPGCLPVLGTLYTNGGGRDMLLATSQHTCLGVIRV